MVCVPAPDVLINACFLETAGWRDWLIVGRKSTISFTNSFTLGHSTMKGQAHLGIGRDLLSLSDHSACCLFTFFLVGCLSCA